MALQEAIGRRHERQSTHSRPQGPRCRHSRPDQAGDQVRDHQPAPYPKAFGIKTKKENKGTGPERIEIQNVTKSNRVRTSMKSSRAF